MLQICRFQKSRPPRAPAKTYCGTSVITGMAGLYFPRFGRPLSGHIFAFPHDDMQFQRCGGAGQRSSVALPLGINGRTASFNASLYPKTGHPTFFNLTLAAGRPGGIAIFDAERRVAGLPWGGVRPARPQRVAGARPIRSEQDNSSPPAESSNERRRVAARRQPGRRTARLCEPQEHSQQVQPYRLSGSKPAGFGVETGSKRRCASLRGGRLRPARPFGSQTTALFTTQISGIRPVAHPPRAAKPLGDKAGDPKGRKNQPKAPPCVRLTAAPLSLRRICRRPLGFHLDFAHRKTSEIPL